MSLKVGQIYEGTVTGIQPFGAFVSLPDNQAGLVHISEIDYTYVKNVADHLQVGQNVQVKVLAINEKGKINLSIKKAQETSPSPVADLPAKPAAARERPVGFSGVRKPVKPVTFEEKLKQYLTVAESKQAELRVNRKDSRRRSRP